jgi:hypothetical protein
MKRLSDVLQLIRLVAHIALDLLRPSRPEYRVSR